MIIIEYRVGIVEYIKICFFMVIRWEFEDRMIVEVIFIIVKFILLGWGIEKVVYLLYSEFFFSNLKVSCFNIVCKFKWNIKLGIIDCKSIFDFLNYFDMCFSI